MKNIIVLLPIAVLVMTLSATCQQIPFESSEGLIFVEAQVNNKKVSLILDTGASSSLISYDIAGLGKYHLPKMKNSNTSGDKGFNGEAFETKADFEFAGVTIKQLPVFAGNVENLSERTHRKCDGLIGQDILRKFKSIKIDYVNHILELVTL